MDCPIKMTTELQYKYDAQIFLCHEARMGLCRFFGFFFPPHLTDNVYFQSSWLN